MFRIRFHGRGGQGMKTASRVLGTALFLEGYEVQDAPRYGAERRGAPIFAYVRAGRSPIKERGIIAHPDLVVVADETLMSVSAAGVLQGLAGSSVLLVVSADGPEVWTERLATPARVITLAPPQTERQGELAFVSAACAGAAARLCGVVSEANLVEALRRELADHGDVLDQNESLAVAAYRSQESAAGCVQPGGALAVSHVATPRWIDLPFEPAEVSAPTIHAGLTSVQVRTGLWRTTRPVLEEGRCNKCVWVCGSVCPDGVITKGAEGYPEVDYDHCKGCMLCVAQCPRHAFVLVPERDALAAAEGGAP